MSKDSVVLFKKVTLKYSLASVCTQTCGQTVFTAHQEDIVLLLISSKAVTQSEVLSEYIVNMLFVPVKRTSMCEYLQWSCRRRHSCVSDPHLCNLMLLNPQYPLSGAKLGSFELLERLRRALCSPSLPCMLLGYCLSSKQLPLAKGRGWMHVIWMPSYKPV